MQMGEVQSKTGQNDLSENNGLGKMGKHTGREAQKGHLWVSTPSVILLDDLYDSS